MYGVTAEERLLGHFREPVATVVCERPNPVIAATYPLEVTFVEGRGGVPICTSIADSPQHGQLETTLTDILK